MNNATLNWNHEQLDARITEIRTAWSEDERLWRRFLGVVRREELFRMINFFEDTELLKAA